MIRNYITKNLILLLAVMLCSASYGQSKKKINTQLKNELMDARSSYDSIYDGYKDQYRQFAIVSKVSTTGMHNLETKRRQAQSVSEKMLALHHQLNKLGFDANSLVDLKGMKSFDLPNYRVSAAEEKALTENFSLQRVNDTMKLKDLKIDVQNERIAAQLLVYKNATAANKDVIKRNVAAIQLLDPMAFTLDSLNTWYDTSLRIRTEQYTLLKNKLDELKENYRVKGPKGFSEAYKQQFPDLHRIANDGPPIVHDYPHDVVDSGDSWVVDAVPAPSPAEAKKLPKSAADEIFTLVDEPAEFPGGKTALTDYLSKNISYPPIAKEKGIQGKCYLQFIVSRSGQISNVKLMRGVPDCPECDKEAIRVVKNNAQLDPGKISGKEVNSVFNLPVQFKL